MGVCLRESEDVCVCVCVRERDALRVTLFSDLSSQGFW